MRTLPVLLWLSLFIMSGCAAPAAPGTAVPAPPSALEGTVVDIELRPVPNATVTLLPHDRTGLTDTTGAFAFPRLQPGNATLRIDHPDFEPATVSIMLEAAQTLRQDVRLIPLPRAIAHDETFVFQGSFDCASEMFIIGADCLVLFENVTGSNDPITNEQNAFRLLVKPGWETIYLNLTWESGAENQLDGMRLNLEHGNGSKTGHAYQVAQTWGTEQPLEILVTRGEPHPSADYYDGTDTPAMIGDEGEETQVRVFPRGKMTEQFGMICSEPRKCFLGLGVGLDIRFDVHAIVHYAS
ncbi:MAG TPA: carboxypeptidase-like regulatory domain-containing protein [Candidatus Thermoplasmatota archaeon]